MSANDGSDDPKGSGDGGANSGFGTKDEIAAFNQHPAVPIFSKYVEDLLPTFDWFNAKASPLNVLDYGCGNGINLFKLVRLGHSVTGVDVSKAMIDHVQSKITEECKQDNKSTKNDGGSKSDEASSGGAGNTTIYQPTLIQLNSDGSDGSESFAEATSSMFDLVLISLVLHHAKDPLDIVKNLSKTLKEEVGGQGGGKLLIVEFDKTERTEKTRAKMSGNKGSSSTDGGGEENSSSNKNGGDGGGGNDDDGPQAKKMKHDHGHHGHGHDHYLDRDELVKTMTDSGLRIVENKKFTLDVQPPDNIMDCYYVIGERVED